MAERITPREKDFSQWYLDIIQHAQLADNSPVRGCMVLRPNGYALWEAVQKHLDKAFKDTGHRNAYFPMFIPQSFLQKEKDHVDGFLPQCAVVTHGGGKQLEEPLIVRPTSETIINAMYSKWIQSYRDLPVLINQWANVVRWELRTRPFLRTVEFLWQEGHTCHETDTEALRETLKMLDVYQTFMRDIFAIPAIAGEKTPSEKFAGAAQTYCLEAMMQDKKALQGATSHYFADRFAKVFDIKFQNREGKQQYVHQTSWGISTRIVGALIMTHSDDQGLVIPPKAAPIPVVIIPILPKGKEPGPILAVCDKIKAELSKHLVCKVDDRDNVSPGFKFNECEVTGIPLRIEVGPRDLENNQVQLARRDGKKRLVSVDSVVTEALADLDQFQKDLYAKASAFLKENTFLEDDYEKFKTLIEERPGFYQMHWCGKDECEAKVKEDTKATIRCVPFDQIKEKGKCLVCSGPSGGRVIFARNY